jgi:hypothetical protein
MINARQLGREGGRYRWELLSDHEVWHLLCERVVRPISFRTAGREWLRIGPDGIRLKCGYRANGNSPKWRVPLLGWLGTPDLRCNLEGAFVHDALYQYSETSHFPFTRSECDRIFLDLNRRNGFSLAKPYHLAVSICGGGFWNRPNGGESVLLDQAP